MENKKKIDFDDEEKDKKISNKKIKRQYFCG